MVHFLCHLRPGRRMRHAAERMCVENKWLLYGDGSHLSDFSATEHAIEFTCYNKTIWMRLTFMALDAPHSWICSCIWDIITRHWEEELATDWRQGAEATQYEIISLPCLCTASPVRGRATARQRQAPISRALFGPGNVGDYGIMPSKCGAGRLQCTTGTCTWYSLARRVVHTERRTAYYTNLTINHVIEIQMYGGDQGVSNNKMK